jgi:hypothetical protein
MILTEPAVDIIKQTFGQPLAGVPRLRLLGRSRRKTAPFTAQAYADRGLMPAMDRPRTAPAAGSSGTPRPATTT